MKVECHTETLNLEMILQSMLKIVPKSRKIAGLAQCLVYTHKDLSSLLEPMLDPMCMVLHACNLSSGRQRQGRSQEFTQHPS